MSSKQLELLELLELLGLLGLLELLELALQVFTIPRLRRPRL